MTVKKFEKNLSLFKKTDAYEIVMKYSDKEYKALQEILKRFLSCFDGEKTAYTARSSPLDWERARQYVRQLQQDAEYSFIPGDNDYRFLDLRARFMAENTRWILDTEPPGTKIMLWAHNFHISLSQYPGYPFIFMGDLYAAHPSARGAYMLRKSFVLVFIRFRVKARHHEELLFLI